MKDADKLFEMLLESNGDNLSQIFKPLHKKETSVEDNQAQKGRIPRPKTWLRLYAVHYDGKYILTGDTIKLTQNMNTRPHLQNELHKLNSLIDKLDIDSNSNSIGYLEI